MFKRKSFDFEPICGKVFAPNGRQAVLISRKEYINLSPTDYIDINLKTGEMCVRNKFTGAIMTLCSLGEKFKIEKKYVQNILLGINTKFYETE